MQVASRPRNVDHGEVVRSVSAGNGARYDGAVLEGDADLAGTGDDVLIREDVPLGVDHDARTRGLTDITEVAAELGGDDDDTRRGLLVDPRSRDPGGGG